HRFLARLGFCQVAVLRGVSVSALRGRLSAAAAPLVTGPVDGIRNGGNSRLIAARRRLRRRSTPEAMMP
ncbi:MAG TPA: hypothetical protein VFR22_06540, partial [Nocardioidaceae bacterium]|nr:hypothetical protein [Nocardioidaceae bacterium]